MLSASARKIFDVCTTEARVAHDLAMIQRVAPQTIRPRIEIVVESVSNARNCTLVHLARVRYRRTRRTLRETLTLKR